MKFVCQSTSPLKTGIFLNGRVELVIRGWVSCCWVPKSDGARWSSNAHLSERNGWALFRRVNELLLSPKEGFVRINWNYFANVKGPKKRASSWEKGLSSLPEGEWPIPESQRGVMHRMRRTTSRQIKEIEKESINILFDVT